MSELKLLGEACRLLAIDQQRKFMSQRQRAFFTEVRERYINGPDIVLQYDWEPGIIGELPDRYEDYTWL